MKISEIISEARKNPEQNPKVSVNNEIISSYKNAPMLDIGIKNCFVSFTAIDKLGINPMSSYNTPIGIYSYHAKYILDTVGPESGMHQLPFAGEQPYANIFQAAGNIIDLSNVPNATLAAYYKKIADFYAKHSNKPWKESVDIVEKFINDSDRKAKFSDHEGGRLWYVTMNVSRILSTENTTPVTWNKLFRYLGIDGAYDPGIGIIHTSEPNQTVFFSINAIKNNKRVFNKYSYDEIEDMKSFGQERINVLTQLNNAKTPSELADLLLDLSDDPEQPLVDALDEYKIAGYLKNMKNTPAKQYLLNNYKDTRAHYISTIQSKLKNAKSILEIENLMQQTTYDIGTKYLKHNPLKGEFMQKYPTPKHWQQYLHDLEYE